MQEGYDPTWNQPFPVSVLSGLTSGSNLYSWQEVFLGPAGQWVSGASPRFGVNNLREINASAVGSFPFNAKVSLEGVVSGQPYFSYTAPGTPGATGSGSSIEVRQSDATHDVSGVSTLVVDQATGLAWEANSGATYTICLLAASATQTGAVNTSAQSFAGVKTFNAGWVSKGLLGGTTLETTSIVLGVACLDSYYGTEAAGSPYARLTFDTLGDNTGAQGYTAAAVSQVILSSNGNFALGAGAARASYAVNDPPNVYCGNWGTDPSGNVIKGGLVVTIGASDARLKTVTGGLEGALHVVRQVEPITFLWRPEACRMAGFTGPAGPQVGFSAQTLWATTRGESLTSVGEDGLLRLNLPAVVATLWSAVRELSEELAELRRACGR